MTPAAILTALLQFGPTIIPLLAKLAADIKAGRGQQEVTQADWDELARLSALTSASIDARYGLVLPPPPSTQLPRVP